jgi:hypothetical protein
MDFIKDKLNLLEEKIGGFIYGNTPSLPYGFKEKLVKIFPLIVLVLGFSELPYFGDSANGLVLRYIYNVTGNTYVSGFTISSFVYLVVIILELASIPGLIKKSRKAWYLLYYSSIVRVVAAVLGFSVFNIIFMGTLSSVELYFLFHIKDNY